MKNTFKNWFSGFFKIHSKNIDELPKLDSDTERRLEQINFEFYNRYTPEEYKINYEFTEDQLRMGIVIFLWWVSKNDLRASYPPSYFFFEYGVEADEAVRYCNLKGLMNKLALTEFGFSYLEDNNQIVENHRGNPSQKTEKVKSQADAYISTNRNFSDIRLIHTLDEIDKSCTKGQKLLSISEELTKRKEYDKSIDAAKEALFIGYQLPIVWERIAINERYLKRLDLEEKILIIAIKQAEQYGPQVSIGKKKLETRLERVRILRRHNIKDTVY